MPINKSTLQTQKQNNFGTIPSDWNIDKLNIYLSMIIRCLYILYYQEQDLFKNNLCERCLIFRFGFHLQNLFDRQEPHNGDDRYFVDCDYNSSFYYDGKRKMWIKRGGKPIADQKTGKITKRFIDIIVHKRDFGSGKDLICFEFKKWNNCTDEGVKKDINNLEVLTTQYGYSFGFHLIFGLEKEETKLTIIREKEHKVIKISSLRYPSSTPAPSLKLHV